MVEMCARFSSKPWKRLGYTLFCTAHQQGFLYTRARTCAARAMGTVATLFAVTALAVLLMFLPCVHAYAAGTAAGTSINNAAQLSYVQGINSLLANSNTASFRVDEIINVRVTAPAVTTAVFSPDQNKALLFLVTNVGNGPESFNLNVNLAPSAADQFDPLPGGTGQLFIDTNGNGTFESGTDTAIVGPVTINADQSLRVLVVSNIPAGRNNGDLGVVTLTAVSTTPGAAAAPVGTILAGAGTPAGGGPPVNAIIGIGAGGRTDSGSDDAANGTYQVSSVVITVTKALLSVTSPAGVTTAGCNVASPPAACAVIIPGTRVTYRITLTVTGAGTAQAVQFSDAIPANTTWVPGNLRVDGAARTDAADGDNASCTGCGSATGAVSVNFGNITVVPATPEVHPIDYQLTIN